MKALENETERERGVARRGVGGWAMKRSNMLRDDDEILTNRIVFQFPRNYVESAQNAIRTSRRRHRHRQGGAGMLGWNPIRTKLDYYSGFRSILGSIPVFRCTLN